ncbi:MAG: IS1380 family transposase [Planctomycetes bacterium]|nr:IS1380 family transposase [Planctomycetota bacterium]MCB9831631.1 IS1380 family transposase [Planctomycetota bacterium]MCB9831823.1 IS1380 family transposase [Planctomycetota bacterium]MCB9832141.1 IS1380 family transposase [Planctomycetota bacterium]
MTSRGPGRREFTASFDGGQISSDAGGLLLHEVDRRLSLFDRFASCFHDYRDPSRIDHSVRDLVAQRVMAIALGYEDLNDHDELSRDPLLAALVGKADPTGLERRRDRDRGRPLASSSTLNRVELSRSGEASKDRYRRIELSSDAVDELLVDLFVESHADEPEEIILDFDATDDPIHGRQEGRFFHGYYDCYCYMPLYIFAGDHLLSARLRMSNQDGAAGSLEELQRIVAQLRTRWTKTRIIVRADSGFCRNGFLDWCEENGVDYVIGLARNARLESELEDHLLDAEDLCESFGRKVALFHCFNWRTIDSWSRERRVIGKAECSRKGRNPRFIVTSLPCDDHHEAERIYRDIYCQRGEMENRIKEQQLDLFADRTSAHTMQANQIRLYFSSIAYVLVDALRRIGLKGTEAERAQCGTIRLKLLKIGARVRVTCRRIWINMSSACPYKDIFFAAWRNICATT